jgi:hypothetical protein
MHASFCILVSKTFVLEGWETRIKQVGNIWTLPLSGQMFYKGHKRLNLEMAGMSPSNFTVFILCSGVWLNQLTQLLWHLQLVLCKMQNLAQEEERLLQFCASWKKIGGQFGLDRCDFVSYSLSFCHGGPALESLSNQNIYQLSFDNNVSMSVRVGGSRSKGALMWGLWNSTLGPYVGDEKWLLMLLSYQELLSFANGWGELFI